MNQKETIHVVLVVGRTGAGKDHVINLLRDYIMCSTEVISYTTRKKKDWETNGLEHFFISDEEADRLLSTEHILARTQIGPYRYFATAEALQPKLLNFYIIDPKGVYYFQEMAKLFGREYNIKSTVLYVKCPTIVRFWRGIVKRCDNPITFWKRNKAEHKMFKEFEESGEVDYIYNSVFTDDDELFDLSRDLLVGKYEQ